MGEPAGIGPELTIKAKQFLKNRIPFFVIGDYQFLNCLAKKHSLDTIKINDLIKVDVDDKNSKLSLKIGS